MTTASAVEPFNEPTNRRSRNSDLHGFAPDDSSTVLLIIDMMNLFRFPGGHQLAQASLESARKIASLKKRLGRAGVAAIYANDNFGRWRSDFRALVDKCLSEPGPSSEIARILHPTEQDYFVLKPKHSAFYSTTLDTLLQYLGAKRLVLTGITSSQCLLFTANDAYIRDYEIWIPLDCTAAPTASDSAHAQYHFQHVLKAKTVQSTEITAKSLTKLNRPLAHP